jgi:CDP-glucose 4,6-dehydratase
MLGMNPDFWRGKRVLLTGHTGFKGGWAAIWLESLGAIVYGVSLQPKGEKNLFEIARVEEVCAASKFVDIRDLKELEDVVKTCQPQIVIHMAAQPLVRESYRDPIGTYETNVMGSLNLLRSLEGIDSLDSILIITTDKCYENNEWLWRYREEDRLGGYDPYSASKACLELMVASYRRSFLNKVGAPKLITARAGNVIGGGDWSDDRLVPDIIRSITSGQLLDIRNPGAIRPWQHVLEPLCGYFKLVEKSVGSDESFPDSWNFGPEMQGEQSVGWIVNTFFELTGEKFKWAIDQSETVHEAGLLKLDSTRANILLDWKPHWTLRQAIEAIVEWHNFEASGTDMLDVCQQQITKFTNSGVETSD